MRNPPRLVARTLAGVDREKVRIGWHFCLGNTWGNIAHGFTRGGYGNVLHHYLDAPVHEYVLDFACRDMRDVDVLKQLPKDKQNTGANNSSGGPMATAGGLVFIAATSDRMFRAFDADTGKVLWEKQLDYAAQTIPMSYAVKGRQYVAVVTNTTVAPMRGPDGRPLNGEGLVVFALPE